MDWKLLRSAAFDSFWNWLLGGVFTIISAVTFFYPDLQPVINFPVLSQVLSPLGLLIIGLIIWLLGFAWNVRKQLKQKPSQHEHETYPVNRNEVQGDGIAANVVKDSPIIKAEGSSVAVGRDLTFNQYVQPTQVDEKFDITPNVIRNEMWVSIDISNPLKKPIECYCLLNSIRIDGNIRNDIKTYVTAHTSRVSWSGGDTKGKEEGIKLIDHLGTLNVATPTYTGLGFEMAKGRRDLDHTMQYGVGLYVVNLDLRYKSIENRTFQSMSFDVNFICYIEKPESRSASSLDIIKSNFGASSLISFSGDNKIDDNLCIRIVKDVDLPIIEIDRLPQVEMGSLNMSLQSMPFGGGEPKRYIPIFVNVSFAKAEFSNHPVNVTAESTAKNVRAKITYLRDDNTVLRTVTGRWVGDGKTDDEEIIDLLSNGKSRTLYLAMRYEEEDYKNQLYMYGMETTTSYFFNRHTDDTYRLYDGKVIVKVEIIGERTQLTKKFVLYNNNKLDIEVISEK